MDLLIQLWVTGTAVTFVISLTDYYTVTSIEFRNREIEIPEVIVIPILWPIILAEIFIKVR